MSKQGLNTHLRVSGKVGEDAFMAIHPSSERG